jgi:hypothetical protein
VNPAVFASPTAPEPDRAGQFAVGPEPDAVPVRDQGGGERRAVAVAPAAGVNDQLAARVTARDLLIRRVEVRVSR